MNANATVLPKCFLWIAGAVLVLQPLVVQAGGSGNLATGSWRTFGSVEDLSGKYHVIRERENQTAHRFQDIPVSSAMGKRALLISYTYAESVRQNDITGKPYVYGYAMRDDGRIASYLQGQSMMHAGESGKWAVSYGFFSLPPRTTKIRLFLKQASRRGTQKDGRAAVFYGPGVFVAENDAKLQNYLDAYKAQLSTLSAPPIVSSSPSPAPSPVPAPVPSSAIVMTDTARYFDEVYDGFGDVSLGSSIVLAPKSATQPSETHAALVTSKQSFSGNYEVRFTMKNIAQLRTGSAPNPWENGWFVFGYKPDKTFKYVIPLKTNRYGVEYGEFLAPGQNFLFTSEWGKENFQLGQWYQIRLRVENNTVTLFVDGVEKMRQRVTSADRLTTDGKIGFYTEDAKVEIRDIVVQPL